MSCSEAFNGNNGTFNAIANVEIFKLTIEYGFILTVYFSDKMSRVKSEIVNEIKISSENNNQSNQMNFPSPLLYIDQLKVILESLQIQTVSFEGEAVGEIARICASYRNVPKYYVYANNRYNRYYQAIFISL